MGIDSGDIVFIKYTPKDNQLHVIPAINPFDVLAEDAINEYKNSGQRR
ncbi:MAG: hypothetical protein PWQ60_1519 [Thermoanaerobacteraceae bacterium]|nr:hypothetical protein [Thermoanaerobacteraceae bacterium]